MADHKHIFKIGGVEEAAGIPTSTLVKAMAELPSRHLTDEQQSKIIAFFNNMKKILEKKFGD